MAQLVSLIKRSFENISSKRIISVNWMLLHEFLAFSQSTSNIQNASNFGLKKNWIQVMSSNKFLCFFPIVNHLITDDSFIVNNDITKKS
ncbi:hypothetical protein T552_04090 [Pneumocystis carinii B80]|uniref:Uncharacterized protein n=1 Tax=Pneumocystis carinii (strain B80) TaxID=1408658 RepID=A0A0W4ZMR9_PNEC8|nr:hypothetical protein T552_04090 [Pneumocystis carinii B80]KTW29651.1 hypothetical protein T552_04090 [Pneumocystis carinii B80]